jgi:hypothetical protein
MMDNDVPMIKAEMAQEEQPPATRPFTVFSHGIKVEQVVWSAAQFRNLRRCAVALAGKSRGNRIKCSK